MEDECVDLDASLTSSSADDVLPSKTVNSNCGDAKTDASDSTPTSSTDASNAILEANLISDDPISSTSTELADSKRNDLLTESRPKNVLSEKLEPTETSLVESPKMDLASDNVDDIAQDLENLLAQPTVEYIPRRVERASNVDIVKEVESVVNIETTKEAEVCEAPTKEAVVEDSDIEQNVQGASDVPEGEELNLQDEVPLLVTSEESVVKSPISEILKENPIEADKDNIEEESTIPHPNEQKLSEEKSDLNPAVSDETRTANKSLTETSHEQKENSKTCADPVTTQEIVESIDEKSDLPVDLDQVDHAIPTNVDQVLQETIGDAVAVKDAPPEVLVELHENLKDSDNTCENIPSEIDDPASASKETLIIDEGSPSGDNLQETSKANEEILPKDVADLPSECAKSEENLEALENLECLPSEPIETVGNIELQENIEPALEEIPDTIGKEDFPERLPEITEVIENVGDNEIEKDVEPSLSEPVEVFEKHEVEENAEILATESVENIKDGSSENTNDELSENVEQLTKKSVADITDEQTRNDEIPILPQGDNHDLSKDSQVEITSDTQKDIPTDEIPELPTTEQSCSAIPEADSVENTTQELLPDKLQTTEDLSPPENISSPFSIPIDSSLENEQLQLESQTTAESSENVDHQKLEDFPHDSPHTIIEEQKEDSGVVVEELEKKHEDHEIAVKTIELTPADKDQSSDIKNDTGILETAKASETRDNEDLIATSDPAAKEGSQSSTSSEDSSSSSQSSQDENGSVQAEVLNLDSEESSDIENFDTIASKALNSAEQKSPQKNKEDDTSTRNLKDSTIDSHKKATVVNEEVSAKPTDTPAFSMMENIKSPNLSESSEDLDEESSSDKIPEPEKTMDPMMNQAFNTDEIQDEPLTQDHVSDDSFVENLLSKSPIVETKEAFEEIPAEEPVADLDEAVFSEAPKEENLTEYDDESTAAVQGLLESSQQDSFQDDFSDSTSSFLPDMEDQTSAAVQSLLANMQAEDANMQLAMQNQEVPLVHASFSSYELQKAVQGIQGIESPKAVFEDPCEIIESSPDDFQECAETLEYVAEENNYPDNVENKGESKTADKESVDKNKVNHTVDEIEPLRTEQDAEQEDDLKISETGTSAGNVEPTKKKEETELSSKVHTVQSDKGVEESQNNKESALSQAEIPDETPIGVTNCENQEKENEIKEITKEIPSNLSSDNLEKRKSTEVSLSKSDNALKVPEILAKEAQMSPPIKDTSKRVTVVNKEKSGACEPIPVPSRIETNLKTNVEKKECDINNLPKPDDVSTNSSDVVSIEQASENSVSADVVSKVDIQNKVIAIDDKSEDSQGTRKPSVSNRKCEEKDLLKLAETVEVVDSDNESKVRQEKSERKKRVAKNKHHSNASGILKTALGKTTVEELRDSLVLNQVELVNLQDIQKKHNEPKESRVKKKAAAKLETEKESVKQPLTITIDDTEREKPYSPKITIKPIKSPAEEEDKLDSPKGSLKMTITKQSDNTHSILKICSPNDEAKTKPVNNAEESIVPKMLIKSTLQDGDQAVKLSTRNTRQTASTSRAASPRVTIKPVVKPDAKPESPVRKLNIKPVLKPEEVKQKASPKLKDEHHVRTRSGRSSPVPEACHSPKITIKPIVKPDEIEMSPKPMSPKIRIKPIPKPEDVPDLEEENKQRIVLKINKGSIPSTSKEAKRNEEEKNRESRKRELEEDKVVDKITLKISKTSGRPHIVKAPDSPTKRPFEDSSESEKTKRLKPNENEVIIIEDDRLDSSISSLDTSVIPTPPPGPKKRGRPRKSAITVREEFVDVKEVLTETASVGSNDSPSESTRPKRSCRGQSVRDTLGIKARKPRGRGTKRGASNRPKEPAKTNALSSSIISNSSLTDEALVKHARSPPMLPSAFGALLAPPDPEQQVNQIEIVETEVPPTKSSQTGSSSSSSKRVLKDAVVLMKDVLEEFPQLQGAIKKANDNPARARIRGPFADLESCSDVEMQPPTPVQTGPDIVMFEEETRMSAETGSRAQTPAKVVVPTDIVEESQSSVQSTATTESGKGSSRKGSRLEVQPEPEGDIISADKLAEYYWGGNGPFMLQEQVAQYLGIKSFKRKYPAIPRRCVDMQERDFIRESCLASEAMCDLGLTAVNSVDILDIMYTDFQDKYEEYCKFQRERQAKDLVNKQKAMSTAQTQERTKMDIAEQAVHSAAAYNQQFNKARKEQRKACMDLQTFNIHYPKGRLKQADMPRIGHYPIALVPGQFCDYYREYTPTEINNLPINTMCYDPVHRILPEPMEDSSDSSSSDSDSSSSDSDSSCATDPENCKFCSKDLIKFGSNRTSTSA